MALLDQVMLDDGFAASLATACHKAQEILKDHAVIDVLINNAGAVFDDGGQAGPVEITFATQLDHVDLLRLLNDQHSELHGRHSSV